MCEGDCAPPVAVLHSRTTGTACREPVCRSRTCRCQPMALDNLLSLFSCVFSFLLRFMQPGAVSVVSGSNASHDPGQIAIVELSLFSSFPSLPWTGGWPSSPGCYRNIPVSPCFSLSPPSFSLSSFDLLPWLMMSSCVSLILRRARDLASPSPLSA